ncbi:phenoloxidase-activating factor 3 isoform X1 [Anopheles gambiae]|uniref:phenoloxidase-activating factor 3 isoform X1 n=1 Tax=Anopheles gambiae TaxID=7165 RepID=UPI002AC9D4C7|nr:phenoloxidase-activating factor 3 isoform X1 [Anopheles gambiae]
MLGVTILLVALHAAHQATAQLNTCTGGNICIPIEQCPLFGSNSRATWTEATMNQFRARACEREPTIDGWTKYKVCCEPPAPSEPKDGRKPGLDLLDLENCGMNRMNSNESVENNDTLGKLPWIALLKTSSGEYHCAGTLISKRYVLTTAFCIISKNLAFVQLRKKDCDERGACTLKPQDIPIERTIGHDSSNKPWLFNNIGLVRLARDASFNSDVRPICLPMGPEYQTTDTKYFIVTRKEDYALLDTDAVAISEVHLVANEYCQSWLWRTVHNSQLCAIELAPNDDCAKPYGASLTAQARNGRHVMYGAHAFGMDICTQNESTVYTRVESFVDWIVSNIEE